MYYQESQTAETSGVDFIPRDDLKTTNLKSVMDGLNKNRATETEDVQERTTLIPQNLSRQGTQTLVVSRQIQLDQSNQWWSICDYSRR